MYRTHRSLFPLLLCASFLLCGYAAQAGHYTLPLLVSPGTSGEPLGVLRILNGTTESGTVEIYAIDDSGTRSGPVTFTLNASAAVEFTATGLRDCSNSQQGLNGCLDPQVGDARLEIETDLDIVPLAFVRAADGTLSAMHDTVRGEAGEASGGYTYEVPVFNPSTDMIQVSRLRLINPGDAEAEISIRARDDNGAEATGGGVTLTLPGGGARTLMAQQLEAGDTGLTGELGAGIGKWRLTVSSDRPLEVVNIVASSTGYWNNLSTTAVKGAAPQNIAAFIDRFVDKPVAIETSSGRTTLNVMPGNRFDETSESDGVTETDMGGFGYAAIGPDAGQLTLDYDDAGMCRTHLYFSSLTSGWFASHCTARDEPDGEWKGGRWWIEQSDGGGEDAGEVVETTYAVNDTLPGVPTSGVFVPTIHGGGSIQITGNDTTISLDDGAYFELDDGMRYTCAAGEGCAIANGTVTAGTVVGRAAGAGEVDRFPSFRTATAPGEQSYTVGEAIDALTLPEASGGNDELTYRLSPVVPGLSFNPATRQLTGTPSTAGDYSMTYTVTDEDGDTDTLAFAITVSAGESREGLLGVCQVGMTLRGGQSCTYPGTTDEFSVNTRGRGSFLGRLAGIRIQIDNETINGRVYDFEASHQGGGVWRIDRIAGSTEPPTGAGTDTSPSFAAGSGPGNRTYTVGTAIDTLTLPAASGGNGTLSYTLSPEVPGLTFDATARQLSGTPTTAASYNMTYTVTDEDGDTDTLAFPIIVEASSRVALLEVSGCTDGRYVDDPGNNAGLVGDCRALVGFVNALARDGNLPDEHVLRRWGAGTQTTLASWAGLAITRGRVTGVKLPGTRGDSGPIEDISFLAALTDLASLDLSYNSVTDVSALAGLTHLSNLWIFENRVSDVSPLSGLTNLADLELGGNVISDIAPLSGLTGLATLNLGGNTISDLSPLSRLTGLTWLRLSGNNVSDIAALSRLTSLKTLDLAWNNVSDITALSELTGLSELWLTGNRLKDISPLAGLTSLTRLGLYFNDIPDLSPLAGLTNLTRLSMGFNEINEVAPLAGLTNMIELDLSNNAIEDLSPLAGLTNLTRLNLGDNVIENVSPLAGLTSLTILELADNRINDISPLSGLTSLTRLDLANNVIEDVSALAGLTKLTELSLARNNIVAVSSLSGLTNLAQLDLSNNAIEDLSPLVANTGLGEGDTVDASYNPLSDTSIETHVATLKSRGVQIDHPLRLDDEFPASRLVHLYNDNVIVMQVDGDLTDARLYESMATYTADFYRWFEDEFDYLVVHSNLTWEASRDAYRNADLDYIGIYLSVMNDTEGLGTDKYLQSRYGSPGRLRGVIHIPGHFHGPLLHELMHAWANYAIPTSHGFHWGFTSANGQLGGFDIATLEDLGNGRWAAGRQSGLYPFGLVGIIGPYSPIELYLAGLAPPEEVPDLWVARDGAWQSDSGGNPVFSDKGIRVFTARNVRTWSIEDIIALNGVRNPGRADVSRDQRAAMILLTDDRHPPHADVLQEMSERASRFGLRGDDGDADYFNYYEATLGRATLTLDGLSAMLKREASAPANLPASFGNPPPPRMTTIEELCGFFESVALSDGRPAASEERTKAPDGICSAPVLRQHSH